MSMTARLLLRALAPTLILTALLATLFPAAALAKTPNDGDQVILQGTVLDDQGQPAEGIVILLEASNKRFSLRHFESRQGAALQLPQKSDAAGKFRFEWVWDRHYNVFNLAFGLEVTRDGAPGFEIVERRDITAQMVDGTPPPLRLKLKDIGWLRWLRIYIDGDASEDEKKLYRELGRPQKITADGAVTSWWYFELGKVYRLNGGHLEQVIPFDPIKNSAIPDEKKD